MSTPVTDVDHYLEMKKAEEDLIAQQKQDLIDSAEFIGLTVPVTSVSSHFTRQEIDPTDQELVEDVDQWLDNMSKKKDEDLPPLEDIVEDESSNDIEEEDDEGPPPLEDISEKSKSLTERNEHCVMAQDPSPEEKPKPRPKMILDAEMMHIKQLLKDAIGVDAKTERKALVELIGHILLKIDRMEHTMKQQAKNEEKQRKKFMESMEGNPLLGGGGGMPEMPGMPPGGPSGGPPGMPNGEACVIQ